MLRKIFLFIFIAAFLVGCSDKPITIEQLRKNESSFKKSLDLSTSASELALRSVSQSYTKLSEHLEKDSLSDRNLKGMEVALADLNRKRNDFAAKLEAADDNGNNLISLLKRRSNENSDKVIKKKLQYSIKIKQESFKKTIYNAKLQVDELDNAIQRFDNIVGYFQVSAGLVGVDSIINQTRDLREGIGRLEVLVKEYEAEHKKLMSL